MNAISLTTSPLEGDAIEHAGIEPTLEALIAAAEAAEAAFNATDEDDEEAFEAARLLRRSAIDALTNFTALDVTDHRRQLEALDDYKDRRWSELIAKFDADPAFASLAAFARKQRSAGQSFEEFADETIAAFKMKGHSDALDDVFRLSDVDGWNMGQAAIEAALDLIREDRPAAEVYASMRPSPELVEIITRSTAICQTCWDVEDLHQHFGEAPEPVKAARAAWDAATDELAAFKVSSRAEAMAKRYTLVDQLGDDTAFPVKTYIADIEGMLPPRIDRAAWDTALAAHLEAQDNRRAKGDLFWDTKKRVRDENPPPAELEYIAHVEGHRYKCWHTSPQTIRDRHPSLWVADMEHQKRLEAILSEYQAKIARAQKAARVAQLEATFQRACDHAEACCLTLLHTKAPDLDAVAFKLALISTFGSATQFEHPATNDAELSDLGALLEDPEDEDNALFAAYSDVLRLDGRQEFLDQQREAGLAAYADDRKKGAELEAKHQAELARGVDFDGWDGREFIAELRREGAAFAFEWKEGIITRGARTIWPEPLSERCAAMKAELIADRSKVQKMWWLLREEYADTQAVD